MSFMILNHVLKIFLSHFQDLIKLIQAFTVDVIKLRCFQRGRYSIYTTGANFCLIKAPRDFFATCKGQPLFQKVDWHKSPVIV